MWIPLAKSSEITAVICKIRKVTVAAAVKSLQLCPTLCDPRDGSPPGSPRPWDSPGKNTGVGCHFLLRCMKVKRESEVAQSYLTCSDPTDCSPPGSSVHGIFQARVLEWGAIALSEERSHHSGICQIDSNFSTSACHSQHVTLLPTAFNQNQLVILLQSRQI